ncbi:MAG: serine/threonine protein kinase [Bryobacterales bacterium]|nr:serine/threonine protein kinase [Bryobacterales bacterium]
MLKLGSRVGRFHVLALVGEGGMGHVYKAHDAELEREVALKALRPDLAGDPQFVERFRKEAITQARLLHPNIAQFYDLISLDGHLVMVMEFVDGSALDCVIKQKGAFALDEAMSIFLQALDGLDSAHKKSIIHRDLKPANIILGRDGAVKVMDFGIARAMGESRMTLTGRIVGTPNYMAPEQVLNKEVDARTDIYAMGIVLYQMLAGVVPFIRTSEFEVLRAQLEEEPEAPSRKGRLVASGVERVILKAIAKDPAKRFQSIAEFRSALLAAQSGNLPAESADAPPATVNGSLIGLTETSAGDGSKRSKRIWVGLSILVVIITATIVIITNQTGSPPPAIGKASDAAVAPTGNVNAPAPLVSPPLAPLPHSKEKGNDTSAAAASAIGAKARNTKPLVLPDCPKDELQKRIWEIDGKRCR